MPFGELSVTICRIAVFFFWTLTPLRLHRPRQGRQRELHPVLHQNLIDVRIGADREGDRQDIGAVGRAGRLHVEHLVDAVDLVLDRQRDRVDHGLGARAGIARGHLDRRRHDVRVFRYRQAIERDRADDDQHDRQHVGEDGMLDEELRNHRRGSPLVIERRRGSSGSASLLSPASRARARRPRSGRRGLTPLVAT